MQWATQVRERTGIKTVSLGRITETDQAEPIRHDKSADLVALVRESLYNHNWLLHAARERGHGPGRERQGWKRCRKR